MSVLSIMAVQAPSGAARWGILLAESISKQFDALRNDLRETNSSIQNIDAKFDALQGRPQDLGGGGPRIYFFRFGNLHVAKRHAAHGEAMRIARGVRGHAPPRNFFKTVQFGAF